MLGVRSNGLAIVVALVAATVANAATYVVPSDRDLVRRADLIVVARAMESHTILNDAGGVETLTTFAVEEQIKGVPLNTVQLFEPGGAYEGLIESVPGAPSFNQGSQYLLFLHVAPDGRLTTHGLGLGRFEFIEDLFGNSLLARGPSEAALGWNEHDGSPYIERLRSADEFLSFVRTTAKHPGSPAASNYVVPMAKSIESMIVIRPTAAYTRSAYMLANPPRWNNGATVGLQYCCSPTFQPAPFDGPTAASSAASMWSATNVIHYTIAGVGTGTLGLSGSDLKSTILFNDPNNYLASYGNGIVALGGVTAASGTTYVLDGEVFYPTKEVDVVVAKNTQFPSGVSQATFTGVIVHELGHTLGFRHADGTSASSSPPPSCAAPLPCAFNGQAIMEHALLRTTLGAWDLDAANTVYGTGCTPPSITTQPQSTTGSAGQSTTLTVVANGTTPTYQWYTGTVPGTILTGQTASSLTVSPVATTSYYVVVTACTTSVTSTVATITVSACTNPSITTQPASQTINAGTSATLSVTGSGTNVTYQWFTGAPGSGVAITGATASTLTVAPTATTTYYVTLTACSTTVTSTAATVTVCTGPSITTQPQNATVTTGGTATLSVAATGTGLTYQWYQGTPGSGTAISGQTATSIAVTPAATTNYYVVVTASCGASVTSSAAVVTVCNPPSITQQPSSTVANPGTPVTLSVTATGSSLTYQWYQGTPPSGAAVSGATAASLTFTPSVSGSYYVVVSSCGTSVTSAIATVTICSLPAITTQPADTSINAGGSATLTAAASGTNVTYQWFQGAPGSGTAITGATTGSLVVTPSTTTTYYIVATACGTSVTSNGATVTVCSPPSITTQPQSITINSGSSATLTVAATGTNATYQWFTGAPGSGTAISGQTGASLIVTPSSTTSYYAVATACGTSATSAAATVTVCNTPVITSQPQSTTITSGNSATLTAAATGTAVTYQWFQGAPGSGTAISGQTTTSLTVAPTTTTTYFLVASSCGVSATSAVATVTVCNTASITSQPQGTTINAGSTTTLSVAATGTNVTYQWFQGSPGTGTAITGQTTSSITVSPSSTTSYYVVVTACGASVTSSAATVTVCNLPAITSQPQNASITAGNSTTLSVTATGTSAGYQWFQGTPGSGTAIAGQTTSSLTVAPVTTTSYYVVVSACSTSVTSNAATVTVCNTPAITSQPQSTSINSGGSATLNVAATGTSATYQWFQGTPGAGTIIGGQTTSALTISPTTTTSYYVVVTACGTSVTSGGATVTVCNTPAISSQPQNASINAGNTTTLSVTATGTSPTYQWFQGTPGSGTAISGQTGTSMIVSPSSTTNYYVVVTACGTSVTSTAATVTVCNLPAITVQPQSATITSGTSTTLTVTATGTSPTYQWYQGNPGSGTVIGGQTTSSLTVSPTSTTTYYVIVTACGTSVTSSAATLTVSVTCNTPAITAQPQGASINAGSSATLTVTATGTNLTYQWFTGTPGSGTSITGATAASITVSPTSTTSYYVVISACSASVISGAATVTVCNPPSITAQPQSTSINAGSSTTLSVTATGNGSYQWFQGTPGIGTAITGQTGTTILVSPTATTSYYVVVTACATPVTSSAATVTVCNPPSISFQPQSVSINSGSSTTLSVTAAGTSLTYQWFQGAPGSGTPISGQTSSSLAVSPTFTTNYYVVVTACATQVTSSTATVTVCSGPVINGQPQSASINSGASVSLGVNATGTNLTYQWYQGNPGTGTAIAAQTASTISVSPSATTSYYVVVTGCGTSVTSTAATVTVCATPAITTQPQSTSINSGGSATLSVAATGSNVTYQWFLGVPGPGTPISGQTSSSILVSPTSTTTYYVMATSCGTSATSAVATVTVCVPPAINGQPQSMSITSGSLANLSVTATGTNLTYQWFQGNPGSGTLITGQTAASLTVSPQATTSYYVVVTACSVSTTSSAATVTVCATPSITAQPLSTSINSGTAVTLTVSATGTNLTYQWFQGSPGAAMSIDGQTTASLTVTPSATTNYYVVLSACGTSVASSTATVTVCRKPVISTQPQSVTITTGSATTLSVVATGTNLTYQWFTGSPGSGKKITAQTAASLTVSPSSTTSYYAVVTACGSSVTSTAATVTVTSACAAPAITVQPQSKTVIAGSPATLAVTATGSNLTYQWYIGLPGDVSQPIAGATSFTVTLVPAATTSYWVRVTGTCGVVNSAAATVTIPRFWAALAVRNGRLYKA